MNRQPIANSKGLWHWLPVAIFAVGAVGYFRLFFTQLTVAEFPQLGTRAAMFFRVLLPDAIFQDWIAEGKLEFGIIDRLPIWVAALFWYALSWWIGTNFLKLCRFNDGCRSLKANWLAARHPLSIAVGLGALTLTTLAIGLCGLLRPSLWMFGALFAWAILATVVFLRLKTSNFLAPVELMPPPVEESSGSLPRRLKQILLIIGGLLVVYYSMAGTMAPVEFDVLEYHLQAPKEFWQQGVITFLPHNIYANMPLGIEMHALAWMSLLGGEDGWWWGALIGKVIIAWMAPLTAWLIAASIYEFSLRPTASTEEKSHASLTAIFAAVLYLALPGIAEVSQFGQIDAGVGLYVFATALLVFQFCFHPTNERLERKVFLIGSVAGLAFSTKYPAFVFAIVPTIICVLTVNYLRKLNLSTQLKSASWLAMGIALTAGPWLLKSTVQTGNPVYPLAASLFGGETLDEQKQQQWQQAHAIPTLKDPPSGVEYRYSLTQALNSLQQISYRSSILSPILVPLLLLSIVVYFSQRETWWWLVWLSGCLACWWLISHRLDRFWIPLLPLACWLAARSITSLTQLAGGIPAAVTVAVGVGYSLLYLASPPLNDPRYLVSLDAQRYDYKGENFSRVSRIIGWLNENLDPTKRVLMVGQAAVFDLEIPCYYSTCFDQSLWDAVMSEVEVAAQRRKLEELGVTHVCIHWGEIERYRSPGNYGFRSSITQPQVADMISQGLLSEVITGDSESPVTLLKVNPSTTTE